MATNGLAATSLSMRSITPQTKVLTSVSGLRSASISSFGRKNVSFNLQPRSIRLQISCAIVLHEVSHSLLKQRVSEMIERNWDVNGEMVFIVYHAKPETVDKVAEIVKKQLALNEATPVTGDSTFTDLGADSLDTVEIVMALEEEFGISVEEDSAQSIGTVKEAADLIEDIIQKNA